MVNAEIYKADPNEKLFIQSRASRMTPNPNELPYPEQDFVSTAWENYYKGFEAGYQAGKVAANA